MIHPSSRQPLLSVCHTPKPAQLLLFNRNSSSSHQHTHRQIHLKPRISSNSNKNNNPHIPVPLLPTKLHPHTYPRQCRCLAQRSPSIHPTHPQHLRQRGSIKPISRRRQGHLRQIRLPPSIDRFFVSVILTRFLARSILADIDLGFVWHLAQHSFCCSLVEPRLPCF